ncbi:MAG: TIGR02171 family protein, partial [Fibrobacter sp.]|nr:TIGR02171 family protein [Fibrobacter sp.]
DSTLLELAEGDELWHPCLWVRPNANPDQEALLDSDSAGVYYQYDAGNHLISSSVEIGIKLKEFWKRNESVEFASLGSSMTLDAVIDDSLHAMNSLNMAVTLADIHWQDYAIRHYLVPYAKNLKAVMVELSPGLLYRSSADYLDFLRERSPGLIYDENHLTRDNSYRIAEYAQEQEYPKDLFAQEYIEGSFLLPSASWRDTYVSVDTNSMFLDNPYLQISLEKIRALKNYLDSVGVVMFMNITPRNPEYRNTGSFGVFGPSRTVAAQIIDAIKDFDIMVFDENKDGLHDYTDTEAFNDIHLSYIGAYKFTHRLDSLLQTLKK